jgi:hypothetical protein
MQKALRQIVKLRRTPDAAATVGAHIGAQISRGSASRPVMAVIGSVVLRVRRTPKQRVG